MNELDCLSCDPFEGDFGLPDDRILRDKIVTARKERPCSLCNEPVVPKTRIRTLVAIFEGTLQDYSWCNKCSTAMAESLYDEGKAWEERYIIGRKIGGGDVR